MASDSSKIWSVFSFAAAIGAAVVAKKTVNTSWQKATGKHPPANPADPDVDIWEAVAWAALSGTVIQIARMLASRKAADYYSRTTGHLPPGLGPDRYDTNRPEPAA